MGIHKPKNPDKMNDFEKEHTPKIECISDKVIVRVGYGIEHPMNPAHFIDRIEVFIDGKSIGKKMLDDEDFPSATFKISGASDKCSKIVARANCTKHGTWESI